jgi:peptidoglycan/xylan/chitin deacetylase (PgdA/CDA1 family)
VPSAAVLAIARRLRTRRSVVIGGHGVATVPRERDPENLCVTPGRFRAQVELLLDAGFRFVTVAELAGRISGGAPPPGLAALSFDDGMENNVSVLLPLLREYGIRATVYVATGLVGAANPWLAGTRMMTADELRELHRAGLELGAHTVSHADLSALDDAGCRREVRDSRATLQDLTGAPVTTFAYPYCRFGPAAVDAVRDAGFAAAVTGLGLGGWERHTIDRAMVTGLDGLPAFVAKLAGVYEPLHRRAHRVRAVTRPVRQRLRRVRAAR